MKLAHDIENHIRCAEAFLEAHRRCDPEEKFEDPSKIALPAIVCAAFASEVALKALLELHGVSAKGHDLQKLIQQLPSHVQFQIQEGTNLPEDIFLKELGRARRAFEDWRYFYEDKDCLMVNVGFLGTLATVILAIIERLQNAA